MSLKYQIVPFQFIKFTVWILMIAGLSDLKGQSTDRPVNKPIFTFYTEDQQFNPDYFKKDTLWFTTIKQNNTNPSIDFYDNGKCCLTYNYKHDTITIQDEETGGIIIQLVVRNSTKWMEYSRSFKKSLIDFEDNTDSIKVLSLSYNRTKLMFRIVEDNTNVTLEKYLIIHSY